MTSMHERKFIFIVGAGAVFLLATLFYWYFVRTHDTEGTLLLNTNPNIVAPPVVFLPPPSDIPTTLPPVLLSSSTMRYQNEYYHISLGYPSDLTVVEYVENNGGRTITFEATSSKAGFQIFVIPYKEAQVSEARFKLDEPSGVMGEPTDVFIDGVRATMFFGQNIIMGETREVWFIKNGFLYEVTTYKALDNWLGDIMRTWKFL